MSLSPKPGLYRAVVVDDAGQHHFSEPVSFSGKPVGLPTAAEPYRDLCGAKAEEQGANVRLSLPWSPARFGSVPTYLLKDDCKPGAPGQAQGSPVMNLLQLTLTTHALYVNGKPFTGCLKIVLPSFDFPLQPRSRGNQISARYYHAGKLLRVDNYAVDDLGDELQGGH